MGNLLSGFLFPHPPILLPEIGRGEEAKASNTLEGMQKASKDLIGLQPDTLVLITPHGPVFSDAVCIMAEENLTGSFSKFGRPELKFEYKNNLNLVDKIVKQCKNEGIIIGQVDKAFAKSYGISPEIDHGVLVPLYFISKAAGAAGVPFRIVHITMGLLPDEDLYRFGMCIAGAIAEEGETGNTVVIASGDLSHRLTMDSNSGYSPKGEVFDREFMDAVSRGDILSITGMNKSMVEDAGECGFRPVVILFGALDGKAIKPVVYSYEGPYAVGYGVAQLQVTGEAHDRRMLHQISGQQRKAVELIRSEEDPYVLLARMAAETFVKEHKVMKIPEGLPQEILANRAGVFVSIKMHGNLRGCIGTTEPTRRSIAEEIIHNAISSSTRDPRFEPVEPDELDQLVYSVDVLSPAESINSKKELDVGRYGVIVRKGARSGLLLPNLEGVDTVDQQISIALKKAGISPNDSYEMERFEVVRHK